MRLRPERRGEDVLRLLSGPARAPGEGDAVAGLARRQAEGPRARPGRAEPPVRRGNGRVVRRPHERRLVHREGPRGRAPLGAVPLGQAKPTIAAALRAFARGAAFEQWSVAQQRAALSTAICVRDERPQPAAVDLTSYLPFLRLRCPSRLPAGADPPLYFGHVRCLAPDGAAGDDVLSGLLIVPSLTVLDPSAGHCPERSRPVPGTGRVREDEALFPRSRADRVTGGSVVSPGRRVDVGVPPRLREGGGRTATNPRANSARPDDGKSMFSAVFPLSNRVCRFDAFAALPLPCRGRLAGAAVPPTVLLRLKLFLEQGEETNSCRP